MVPSIPHTSLMEPLEGSAIKMFFDKLTITDLGLVTGVRPANPCPSPTWPVPRNLVNSSESSVLTWKTECRSGQLTRYWSLYSQIEETHDPANSVGSGQIETTG